jgi:hypothetical protein
LFVLLQLSNEQGYPTWKPVFLAITDKDLMMYDTAPWSKEEWATPFQSHPLLATRYLYIQYNKCLVIIVFCNL